MILGLFAHTDQGARAMKSVLELGVAPDRIAVVGDLGIPAGEAGSMHHVTLDRLGVPATQRNRFMDGIRSGGVVLAISGDPANLDLLLEQAGASLVEQTVVGETVSHNTAP